ncbi:ABC transporter substrate-binding protein [Paenibacillus sp. 481]|uniref:ABC transporter substrate-binding protein n=1 Tax=Paenibacillus sp. 481 TaxID=2835869 RepID=UPI001E319CCD|nr:iron-siderophore ABC transporter substrate-binding protein [Paenibacillus sp. 481]UHA73800.1 iron-siderophore ABC transporter substrate-binding protein [Paenibacillus sp. 481]
MQRRNKFVKLSLLLMCTVIALFSTNIGGNTSVEAAGGERVVKHGMGQTTIKGTPKRVIVLTNEGTEAVLAMGVTPVGAVTSWEGDPWYPHIAKKMKGVKPLGDETQPNLELIFALKPDLIIGNKARHEKIYPQLSKIAPTVYGPDLTGKWKDNFNVYADALNKKAEGKKALAAYDKHVADVKKQLGKKVNKKVSIARFQAAQVRIYQLDTFSGVILKDLGLQRPAAQNKNSFIEKITKERMADLDGDIMFYWVAEKPGSTDAANNVKDWFNDPLFKNLNVAKTKQVHKISESIWNSAGGIMAANLMLDELAGFFKNVK